MRVAIASTGDNENSEMSPIAGRAPYYLIYENKKLVKAIKNPFAVGGGGAGFGVAKMLKDENVNLVISGHFGENMINALKDKGINKKEVKGGTVKEVIENA